MRDIHCNLGFEDRSFCTVQFECSLCCSCWIGSAHIGRCRILAQHKDSHLSFFFISLLVSDMFRALALHFSPSGRG